MIGPGDQVGRFKVLAPLGEGGMGVVFMAEDAMVERRVALKLPTWGLEDTAATAARFAQERDFLAGLEHAHIARLYDAGVSEDGQPYLIMEYADGRPLTSDLRLGAFAEDRVRQENQQQWADGDDRQDRGDGRGLGDQIGVAIEGRRQIHTEQT